MLKNDLLAGMLKNALLAPYLKKWAKLAKIKLSLGECVLLIWLW